MYETSSLLSAILAVVHPGLYRSGSETIQRLWQGQPHLNSALQHWGSVFNAVTILANRETPQHRDNLSRAEWYDMLASVGLYQDAIFELPGVGVRLSYYSGTVIAFSGKILRHGVPECEGERVCLAYYMRDNVHERMGVEAASWMKTRLYSSK